MNNVFIAAHNIISPLGFSSEENFQQLLHGNTGLQLQHNEAINDEDFWAALFTAAQNELLAKASINSKAQTRFEQLLITSVTEALSKTAIDIRSKDTVILYSSTKGNVVLLENENTDYEAVRLHHSAALVNQYFNNPNKPIIISNACISGVLAIVMAQRLLAAGKYKHAVIVGADTIGKFVYSGFKSFQALSPQLCKPFSADRDGINLGEAGATMILTTEKAYISSPKIMIAGGAVSNDANHISGPSRTGEELSLAINTALKMANVNPNAIDLVSAHGTATLFNDEMEAKAFTISNLQDIPTNSLKAYYGHTLGAAGIVEAIIAAMSIAQGKIIPTKGFTTLGVPVPINICQNRIEKEITHVLKTASGFGGCNAALVMSKIN